MVDYTTHARGGHAPARMRQRNRTIYPSIRSSTAASSVRRPPSVGRRDGVARQEGVDHARVDVGGAGD